MLLLLEQQTSGLQAAVAAQTARSRCKVLSIQYVYYLKAYQRHDGRQMIR